MWSMDDYLATDSIAEDAPVEHREGILIRDECLACQRLGQAFENVW